ncbi:MAG: DUF3987 domain-containing protein [Planctomycetales bacterium]|nr:DUF3987 domain-containing protein [Planctomycetales bacterium]
MSYEPIDVQTIISALKQRDCNPHRDGDGWRAKCPCHSGTTANSLAISADGKIYCHGCGTKTGDVLKELGLNNQPRVKRRKVIVDGDEVTFHDDEQSAINGVQWSVFQKQNDVTPRPPDRLHRYHDADGNHVGSVVLWKFSPELKEARQIRKHGDGWICRGMTEPRPLYDLPTVIGASSVVVVEGEKSADALRSIGLVATTPTQGAKSPAKTDWSVLKNKSVTISVDNDQAGREFGKLVIDLLPESVVSIKVVELKDDWSELPVKGDAADWVQEFSEVDQCSLRNRFKAMPDHFDEINAIVPTGSNVSTVLSVPHSGEPEIQWPELIDLEEPPIDRLATDLLPGWYGDMIRAVAVSTETPIEMAALVGLGAIATATMRKYDVLIESGFRQSLNLYCVSVMEPGNRKSAVFRALMAAIDQFERELRQAAIEIIKIAESQFQTWKRRVDDLRGKAGKAKSHGDFVRMQQEIESLESQTPVVPQLPQLTCDDATPESICSLLAGNDERLTLSSAEPDLFDMMLGRYSSKPNLGIYLKGHDGDSHKENRKSGIPVSLAAPLLTICVMAQPEAVEDAGQQKVLKGRGLLARILFVMPPSPVGYRDCVTRPVPQSVVKRYDGCMRRLLSVKVVKDEYDRPKPRLIRMSQEGHRLWKQEQLRIESDQRDGGRLSAFKDWAGKFPAAIARIAGNLHAANCVESGQEPDAVQIPAATMETSIQFARIIESHTLRVFGAMNADKNRKTAIKIIRTIRKEQLREITKRDCMRADRTVDSVTDVEPAIELMVRDGYLIPFDDEKKRGRPSVKYRVNPAVHLKSDDAETWDNKDGMIQEPETETNYVLFVPESDESEIEVPADDPVDADDYDFSFASDGKPPF